MKIVTKYIAYDGKKFNDKSKCLSYELDIKFNEVKNDIAWYDKSGSPMEVSHETDFSYAYYVQINTMRAAKVLYDYCYERGYECPCVDEDRRLDTNYLGKFWWDDDQNYWKSLNKEKQKLADVEAKFS